VKTPTDLELDVTEGDLVRFREHRTVQEVGPEAAAAFKEYSKNQFAVPARQESVRAAFLCATALAMVGVAAFKLNGTDLAWTIGTVAGLLAAGWSAVQVIKALKG
jgi:hypothetical protein